MYSVLDACKPRPEILAGTFNPEVFTASLSPFIEYYRTGRKRLDNLYTDAELFFREATYPTQGLRTTLTEVFARIAGDLNVPAIHRLETAFGGGKTHTLIACTHIAFRGRQLQQDRKSTRLNSSHVKNSYAVFCLKKKKKYTFSHLDSFVNDSTLVDIVVFATRLI